MAGSYLGKKWVYQGTQVNKGVDSAIKLVASSSKSKGWICELEWMGTLTQLDAVFQMLD